MKSLIGPVGLAELVEIFRREQRLVADFEADHGHRPACLEDDLRRFGIVIDVGFGGGVDVAAGDRAAHEDDFLHERNDGRILFDRERDIGERADGYQRDFVRRGVHQLDDEIGTEAGVDLALAGRQFDVGQAVLAVPELGGDQLLKERMLCSGGDGDIAAVRERDHAQGIFEAHFRGDVAGHDRDGADVEFGRIRAPASGPSASSEPGSVSKIIFLAR